jgi:hypothetical protein
VPVAVHRCSEKLKLQDTAFRLRHTLSQHIQEEKYEAAAEVRDALAAEDMRRDTLRMWSHLDRQLKSSQALSHSISHSLQL